MYRWPRRTTTWGIAKLRNQENLQLPKKEGAAEVHKSVFDERALSWASEAGCSLALFMGLLIGRASKRGVGAGLAHRRHQSDGSTWHGLYCKK